MASLMRKEKYVYRLPVQRKVNPDSKQDFALCYYILLACIICLFIFLWFLPICFQLIRENTIPKVDVDDVNLTRFMMSPTNNTLYYYVSANMTFRNPYSIVGIHFRKIDADLMYQGQRLGTKEIFDVFYLPPKKDKSNVNVILRSEQVLQLINGDEKLVYESENKSGVYKISVNVRSVMSFMWLNLNTGRTTLEIMCDNLQVS